MNVELPWPPASFSGNQRRSWYLVAPAVKKHREWASEAAQAAGTYDPGDGDIRVVATFYPPSRRGDRVNYPSLLKPYWDGLADAMGVNDKRFLPSFVFAEPVKGGRVVLSVIES